MWLSDFALVLPDRVIPRGSLRIENGLIAEIVETVVPGGVRGDGMQLFPGFVDMHGDMIEVELEPRVQVDFPMDVAVGHLDARLAASGVTTAYAGVSFSRGAKDGGTRTYEHTSKIIRALRAAIPHTRVDHRIHARFDVTFENAVGVLEELLRDKMVDLVSVMDHTPGQGQYRNLERHIELRAKYHGVSLEEARAGVQARMDDAAPAEQVLATLQQVSRLCKTHDVPLASHDDDTVEKAHLMADLGIVISEFPVTLEAAEAVRARGITVAMGSPNAMRGQSFSGNLSARAAHDAGFLDILASDYHPAAILPAIRALTPSNPDGLPGAARLATLTPAQALGLTDRGAIELGKRADLVAFDAKDRAVLTLVNGETAFSNGTLAHLPQPSRAVA